MEHLECIWTKCGRGAERFFFLAVLEFFFLAIASFPLCHKCIRVARGDGHGPRAKLRDAICGPVRSNHSPPVPRPVCAPSSSTAAQSATSRTSIIEIGERANGCEHSSASRRGPATPVHGQSVSRRRPRSQRRCGGQAEEAAHRHLVHEQVRAQHRVRQAQLCEQRLHLRGHGLEDTHQNSPSVMPACPQPFLPPGGRRMGRPASSRGPAALSTA